MLKKIDHAGTCDANHGATVVLRIKKLKMPQVVRIASEHNKRVRFQSHPVALRSTRSGQSGESGNECLYGPATPEEVADHARQLMEKSGVARLRKDAVRAIEIMISLSSGHSINDRDFFVDSMYWFAERLGGRENLISADLHRDESNDHVHLLIVPLVGGRMNGSQLLGGKGKFRGHKSDFDHEVCRRHGLHLVMKDHLSKAEKGLASAAAIDVIHQTADPVLSSPIWKAVKTHISVQPESYLGLLGLEPSMFRVTKKMRTLAQIMTSKGKGPDKEIGPEVWR